MKYLTIFCLIFFCQFMTGCTNSHEFGPYQGKVVDKETLNPLEDAVIYIEFYTESGFSPGGAVGHFADAVETLTDKNGEFYIPVQKLTTSSKFHRWDECGIAIVFKPGYGAYPKHKESEPQPSHFCSKSPQEYFTIQLPKLQTIEERKRNLPSPGIYVPECKKRNILRLESIEAKLIGLEPLKLQDEDE